MKVSRNIQSILILVGMLIPSIPIALLWNWLNPVGFWQYLVMLPVGVVIYIVCIFAEVQVSWILQCYKSKGVKK